MDWIQRQSVNPGIPFLTSIGVFALQLASWPILFVVGVPMHLDPPILLQIAIRLWFFIPLLSVLGIAVAVMCLWKRKAIAFSAIGLVLNVVYLLAFLFVAYGTFSGRLSV